MFCGKRIYSFLVIAFIVSTTYSTSVSAWVTEFEPKNVTLHMHDVRSINLTLTQLNVPELIATNATIRVVSDKDILEVTRLIPLHEIQNGQWRGQFNVSGTFLGRAQAYVEITWRAGNVSRSTETFPVVIIREERFIDKMFTISVASLVSILYINFGAALDMRKVRAAFVRPIGPVIALLCHYLVLPVVSLIHRLTKRKVSFQ